MWLDKFFDIACFTTHISLSLCSLKLTMFFLNKKIQCENFSGVKIYWKWKCDLPTVCAKSLIFAAEALLERSHDSSVIFISLLWSLVQACHDFYDSFCHGCTIIFNSFLNNTHLVDSPKKIFHLDLIFICFLFSGRLVFCRVFCFCLLFL